MFAVVLRSILDATDASRTGRRKTVRRVIVIMIAPAEDSVERGCAVQSPVFVPLASLASV